MNHGTYKRIPVDQRAIAGSRMSDREKSQEKVTDISKDLKISRKSLYSLEKKYLKAEGMGDRLRTGAPKKVKPQTEHKVGIEFLKHPFQTRAAVMTTVNEALPKEEQISKSTVGRIAIKAGLLAYRPAIKPRLTPAQILTRK
jgi:hypothetical protein